MLILIEFLKQKTDMKKIFCIWLFLFSASICSQSLEPNQVYSTGNIVQPTIPNSGTSPWVNGVYQGQLTCFGWGMPGYCGPNPITTPGYNINFSYGYTDIHQNRTLSQILPDAGNGLRINGYHFSFFAKNGNGWDDGRTDVLYAYVQFDDRKGSSLFNHTHDLNYRFNWTEFNLNYNFDTPYKAKDIGTVRYGFIGKDNNYWAGPYGPEVTNINFSLKYSVDPCKINPLHSASCEGFSEALAKVSPMQSYDLQPVNYGLIPNSVPQESIEPLKPIVVPAPTTTNTVSISLNQSTRVDNSVGLSIVARNQQRETNIANQAVQNALNTASQLAEMSQQEAINVTSLSVAGSQNMNAIGINSQSSIGFKVTNSTLPSENGLRVNELTGLSDKYSLTNNTLLDKTDPINSYLEDRPNTNTQPINQSSVNSNVRDNELSNGNDFARLATVPIGFNNYTNLVLKDNTFYTPKEVYPNQKTIDNTRALRQLSSDKLHNEMIEEQYRR